MAKSMSKFVFMGDILILVKYEDRFRNLCWLGVICCIVMISSPIITLAFYAAAEEVTSANLETSEDVTNKFPAETIPEKPLPVCYLDDIEANIPIGNKPVYDKLLVTERKAQGLSTVLPAVEPYYGEKVVYLTFDDGPDPVNTPQVLEILHDQGIKGTFFIVGSQMEKNPELIQRIYDEGHALGNHTYNHVYRELYKTPATYLRQLQHNDALFQKYLGVRPLISRAPGGTAGSLTKNFWEKLRNEGYIDIGWNVSSGDASRATARDILANITEQINSKKYLWSHVILLMHDGCGHSETVKALPEIISFFKVNGFEFRVINLETPQAW